MKNGFCLFLGGLLLCLAVPQAWAHCEIPCGIYNDELRVQKIAEDLTTIEKSMNQIQKLSKDPKANINQFVRWVESKEVHADDIRQIVTQYFLAQRVKFPKADNAKEKTQYTEKLTLLHRIIVHAMKAKQTTDLDHVETLRALLAQFRAVYFGAGGQAHLETHHPAHSG